eukprot:851975-Pleurochrysis_carterae.AAC.1
MHHSSTVNDGHVGQSVGRDFPDEGRTATRRGQNEASLVLVVRVDAKLIEASSGIAQRHVMFAMERLQDVVLIAKLS